MFLGHTLDVVSEEYDEEKRRQERTLNRIVLQQFSLQNGMTYYFIDKKNLISI